VIAVSLVLAVAATAWATPPLGFGAAVKARAGQTKIQAVQSLEGKIDRKLELVRVYGVWNDPFPDEYVRWLTDAASGQTAPGTPGGRTLIYSIKAKRTDGTRIPWADIANAPFGSALYDQIVSWARRIKTFGQPMYLSFNHEPESAENSPNGTPAEYIAAWKRVRTIFQNQGVTNVTWTWIATAFGFTAKRNQVAARYYPGDAYVDVIGVDGYNWYRCRPNAQLEWKSAQAVFQEFRAWAAQHPSVPVIVTEFGSVEDPADAARKARWISEASSWFKAWDQLTAAVYWSSNATKKFPDCVFFADTSPESTAAYRGMGLDPAYRPDFQTG
jgi:hypothetical protein